MARSLGASGLRTVRDLLLRFPRRLREVQELEHLQPASLGRWVRLHGLIDGVDLQYLGRRRSIVTVRLALDDGEELRVPFFNQPYLAKAYTPGERRLVEGILEQRGRRWTLTQGKVLSLEAAPEGACQLRYAEIPGVSEQRLKSWIRQALLAVDLSGWSGERLPPGLDADVPVADIADALRAMHMPRDADEHEGARRRFAVLEAVRLFRRVERARRQRLSRRGPCVEIDDEVERRIEALLPFEWTDDQAAAVAALRQRLQGPEPMGLLMHGDVGTGKTAVALYAALAVIAAGHQAAVLAPTELLAEQHHEGLSAWLAESSVRVALLTSSLGAKERRQVEEDMATGRSQLVIGTHALMSEGAAFADLGLVVIDEQHRFGVEQRMQLVRKGRDPHVLVMTATPIPRTFTLALFGDLDVVGLRQKPRGRPVPALFLPPKAWPRLLRTIERHVARGEQAYVVCPRVGEDGEKGGAVRLFDELSSRFRCGLVHGRMPAAQRRDTTAAFRRGELSVLVGTTVLEVGVDVPRSTLMVVVGADRFGLATLHQLRGRVGRGSRRGLCVLTGARSARTEAVCQTTDGFELAETDLRLRGAGELLGQRQSGLSDLFALDPVEDIDLLQRARDAVRDEAELEP